MSLIYLHKLKEPFLSKSSTNGCYVGKTIFEDNPNKRWRNGKGYLYYDKEGVLLKHQYAFGNALLKYGWDNFEHIILEDNISNVEIDEREIYWIEKYDSFRNGYNETSGGGGSTGFKHSEETKDALRVKALERYSDPNYVNPNIGRKMSEEQRIKSSEYWKRKYKENPELAEDISRRMKEYYSNNPEVKKEISDRQKGKKISEEVKQHLSKKVAEYYEIDGNREKHGLSIKQYYIDNPEAREKRSKQMTGKKMPISGRIKQSEKQKRKVLHIDSEGNETIYDSRKSLVETLGIDSSNRSLKNALKTGEKVDATKFRKDNSFRKFHGHQFLYLNSSGKYGGENYLKEGDESA